jgi:putative SOS response-associated peptidase YedK
MARLVHLFQPYPADMMEMQRVPLVNSVKNESADLIDPASDSSQQNLGMEI